MPDIQSNSAPRKPLPVRVAQFDTQGFVAWLAQNGAEIGIPTNAYEVARYRAYTDGGKAARTHIIYAKESGLLTWPGETRDHYASFLAGKQLWPGYPQNERGDTPFLVTIPKGGPPKGWVRPDGGPFRKDAQDNATAQGVRRQRLIDRDGDGCWFCGRKLGSDVTIEHLVPKSKGGRNMLANYALAHAACNRRAANLPLVKKIELRAIMRADSGQLVGDA